MQAEEERLVEWHDILDVVFGQNLFLAPVSNPRSALDCGFGAGSWAIEVSEQISHCEVGEDFLTRV